MTTRTIEILRSNEAIRFKIAPAPKNQGTYKLEPTHPVYHIVKTILNEIYALSPETTRKLTGNIDNKECTWLLSLLSAIRAIEDDTPNSGKALCELLESTPKLDQASYDHDYLRDMCAEQPSSHAALLKGTIIKLEIGTLLTPKIAVTFADGHGGIQMVNLESTTQAKEITNCLNEICMTAQSAQPGLFDLTITPGEIFAMPQITNNPIATNALNIVFNTIFILAQLQINPYEMHVQERDIIRAKRLAEFTCPALTHIVQTQPPLLPEEGRTTPAVPPKQILVLYVNNKKKEGWDKNYYEVDMDNLAHALMLKKQVRGHCVSRRDIHESKDINRLLAKLKQEATHFDQICFVGHCQIHLIPPKGTKISEYKEVRPIEERHAGGFEHELFGKFCYHLQRLSGCEDLRFFMCEFGIEPGRELEAGNHPDVSSYKTDKTKHYVTKINSLEQVQLAMEHDQSLTSFSTMSLVLFEMYKAMLTSKNAPAFTKFRATAPNGALLFCSETGYKWDAFDISQYESAENCSDPCVGFERDARKARVVHHVEMEKPVTLCPGFEQAKQDHLLSTPENPCQLPAELEAHDDHPQTGADVTDASDANSTNQPPTMNSHP